MVLKQNNYLSNQDYEININDIYNDFIKEIDAVRSFINISNGVNQQILNNITIQNLTSLNNLLKVEDSAQESRCHAFFRLIGFPVVASDTIGTIYNPGLDNISNSDMKLSLEEKLVIARKPIPKFNELSVERELFVSKIRDIFIFNQSIDASTLALSSGVNIRNFAYLDKVDTSSTNIATGQGAFTTKKDDQSYSINYSSKVGNRIVSLLKYQDVNGLTPTKLFKTRSHIILPFIVDPRIDFTVSPSENKIAVPFVFNKSNTKISETSYVRRPLLEKIIRDRFTNINPVDSVGSFNNSIFSYITNNPVFKDQEIIDRVIKDPYKLSERLQFFNFINIINAMMIELVNAQKKIEIAQSKYYYLPIPSINGPELGNSVRGVLLTSVLDSKLITSNDQNIINATIINATNQINSQIIGASGTPDPGDFAFNSFKTTFNSDTTSSLGSISETNLQGLNSTRTKFLQKANEGLQTVEIIMGEFSGLGLCDIIAIMGALYIMPRDHLVGFLDRGARLRAESILKVSLPETDISTAMTSLVNNVKDFYNIMDKVYQNNGRQ